MARINLLPWREEKRRERQKQFMFLLGMTLVSAAILVFLINTYANAQINGQNDRNDFLRSEIRKLDSQIRQIDELEKTRDNLLSRKQIIENLQGQRSLTVMLLQELVETTPIGVTLGAIRQQGSLVTLSGTTQSNARVSAYLQGLMQSDLFKEPDLQIVEAEAKRANSVEPYNFSIRVKLGPLLAAEQALRDGGSS